MFLGLGPAAFTSDAVAICSGFTITKSLRHNLVNSFSGIYIHNRSLFLVVCGAFGLINFLGMAAANICQLCKKRRKMREQKLELAALDEADNYHRVQADDE